MGGQNSYQHGASQAGSFGGSGNAQLFNQQTSPEQYQQSLYNQQMTQQGITGILGALVAHHRQKQFQQQQQGMQAATNPNVQAPMTAPGGSGDYNSPMMPASRVGAPGFGSGGGTGGMHMATSNPNAIGRAGIGMEAQGAMNPQAMPQQRPQVDPGILEFLMQLMGNSNGGYR